MKKILILSLALFASVRLFAQQQLATLNHNDTLSAFYGPTALQQAHSAAVVGDIITLSSGFFNGIYISKAITIRGAGMVEDTATGTLPTFIGGDYSRIWVSTNDSIHHLTFEGINFASYVICTTAYNPQFIKCKINYFSRNTVQGTLSNASFVNCIIKDFLDAKNSQFINSVIFNFVRPDSNLVLYNCVAGLAIGHNYTCTNSILCGGYSRSSGGSSYSCNHCVGLNTCSNYTVGSSSFMGSYFDHATLTNNCVNFRGTNAYTQIFKTFTGSYSDNETYELLDTMAATLLGNDGTQVGIYGGVMPFSPYVRHPRIGHCNVATRSTADGRLPVDIEVISE